MQERRFDQVGFLTNLIEQSPDNSVAAMHCNWISVIYSDNELAEIKKYSINSIQDCRTDRQAEVFKSSELENYKYLDTKFGKFNIWEGGLNLLITINNKHQIAKLITENFENRDVCHCQIYTQSRHIAECYDIFIHSRLDSNIFKFTTEEKQKYEENDIDIYFDKFD